MQRSQQPKLQFLCVSLVMLTCLTLGLRSWAYGEGTTGADILQISLGARPNALGGAYSAVDGDAQSLLYNPAALSFLSGPDIVFQRYLAFEEVTYDFWGYVQPIKDWGTWGGNFVWRHMPAIDNPGASDAPVDANDMVLTMGGGRLWKDCVSGVSPLFDQLAVGGALKVIYLSLRETHAVSAAVDVGAVWTLPDPDKYDWPLTLAASLQNAGAPVRFINEADPLPLCLRLGVSTIPWSTPRHKFLVTGEWVMPLYGEKKTALGVEYTLAQVLALRAGYRFENSNNINGPSAGLGISFLAGKVTFRFDYTYQLTLWNAYNTVDNNHFFSLGCRF